jgi:hypothetical protein
MYDFKDLPLEFWGKGWICVWHGGMEEKGVAVLDSRHALIRRAGIVSAIIVN